ncbi:MAG: hypothetical protein ABL914_12630 [Novosphingobium sp.]|uniref:hypothetical protein n=1 Tax=Novosphingobium sp. TaxID=1874826 RepID=UPI0032BA59F0
MGNDNEIRPKFRSEKASKIRKPNSFMLVGSGIEAEDSVQRDLRLNWAKEILRERMLRRQFMEPEIFGEPAWDILISAYLAEQAGVENSVVEACTVCRLNFVVGFRWFKVLEGFALISRIGTGKEFAMRAKLTQGGQLAIDSYLDAIMKERTGRH